jgi:glycosyltransferase involved in cell wall biosynthesis
MSGSAGPGRRLARLSRYRPRNLHVGSWGGGLAHWVASFCAHDPYSDSVVLTATGTPAAWGLRLVLAEGRTGAPLEQWTLRHPICTTAITNPEYRQLLVRLIDDYRIDHVYVSSLIGQSLDLLALGVPATVVHHSYYPWCVALNILFEDVCTSCGPDRLARCLVDNEHARLFRHPGAGYWLRLREAYIERAGRGDIAHVVPTWSVARHLRRLEPRFRTVPLVRIGHGVDASRRDCFGGATEGRRLRILVLGRLTPAKGASLLRQMLPQLTRLADVQLVGCGAHAADLEGRPGISVVRQYEPAALGDILAEIRPDLALFCSVVPETFSLALSEAWAHGLPACAVDRGAFAERIRPGDTGFLFDPEADRALALLSALERDREALRRAHRQVQAQEVRTWPAMVDEYYRLRDDYLASVERVLDRAAIAEESPA